MPDSPETISDKAHAKAKSKARYRAKRDLAKKYPIERYPLDQHEEEYDALVQKYEEELYPDCLKAQKRIAWQVGYNEQRARETGGRLP
jgi:hypothetical protein